LDPLRTRELRDDRPKRVVGVVGPALVAQARMRLAGDALGESRRKAGLANPRLTRDQHNLPLALPGNAFAFQQEIDLVLATDEIGQTRRADRLEATLGNRHACDRPSRDRLSNTLDLVPAKVAEAEKITQQPTRGGGDHNHPSLAQGLKAGCYGG